MANVLDKKAIEKTAESEYESLLRALRRRKGFGLLFVESTPVGGLELIAKIKRDLPQKKIDVLNLDKPITNLIEKVENFPDQDKLNILFITGLEKSLVEYIRPGYGGKAGYYNLDTIPPILSHLNWQRENFRDQFRRLCFVFILPKYAIKYILLRSPDFFDWASVFILVSKKKGQYSNINWTLELIELLLLPILAIFFNIVLVNYNYRLNLLEYCIIIIAISCLTGGFFRAIRLSLYKKTFDANFMIFVSRGTIATFWELLGIIFLILKKYKKAFLLLDRVVKLDPYDYKIWGNRGIVLDNLGRYEEALISYETALDFKPRSYKGWNNRGNTLANLGRLEESIACYERALQIKPNYSNALNNRGTALADLGKYEEAIASYDEALKIKPDDYGVWNNRGYALLKMGNYQGAIENIDQSLKIEPNPWAYESKAYAYILLDNIDLAIENLRYAIEIDPNRKQAIVNDPDFYKIRNTLSFQKLIVEKH